MTSTYSSNKTGITYSSYKDVTYVKSGRPKVEKLQDPPLFDQSDVMPPHHSYVDELFGTNKNIQSVHFEPPEGYHYGSHFLFRKNVLPVSGGLAKHPFVKLLTELNDILRLVRANITRFQKG